MKNNLSANAFQWAYVAGFTAILALPILDWSPWFYPADWGKTILFRSIVTVLLCLFAWQYAYRPDTLFIPSIKKNRLLQSVGLFCLILLVSSIFSVDPYFSFLGSPLRSGGAINIFFYAIFAVL